ncbi:hypothetical protein ACD591_03755 [Rufibacter glacialis]|uniref:Uncharacterized protein n=1 Tax=Rufibacter glacialis TaxID=1259555 RepID=A0A5M8QGY3_9BACT|nr:hypothetical protein [Rufibacter glacialis]KAA6434478.1 hypothetical protein FOE74_09825 [Rufibacter glacialis]GGK70003.1 hypothetical protein GCM10011405_17560 [Rufibacter glacialis]
MPTEIKEILIDVRNSFRFLFQYQKRVLDLVSYIGSSYGFRYSGGFTKFSGPTPRNGKGSLSNWAWDWLPFYFYEFYFGKLNIGQHEIAFSVFILNDTGFFAANELSKTSKTKVSSFESAENSDTKLIFVAGKNLWEPWGNNWNTSDFVLKNSGIKLKDENSIMIFKSYNLEEFINEDSALIRLKDFESHCAQNNIQLTIIKRNFDK